MAISSTDIAAPLRQIPPPWISRSRVLTDAFTLAAAAHGEQQRPSDGYSFLEHVVEVGELLHDAGFDDELVAAGLLHDAVERGTLHEKKLRDEMGASICSLVMTLSEDPEIASFDRRKAGLRRQVESGGDQAVTVYAADKLSDIRGLRRGIEIYGDELNERLGTSVASMTAHYRESVEMVESVRPGSVFLSALRLQLEGLEAMTGELATEDRVLGEPRWPMASAVIAAIVLTILLPDDLRLGPNWLLPVIVGVLLVAHIAGDPGRIDRRTAALRLLSIGLVSVLVVGALWATAVLISHLLHGGKESGSADALLEAGSIVWVSNIIAFALLYWDLDGGGAAERAHQPSSRVVDLAFPQQMNPARAPAHWRPRFIDYLYLGFTNATAFSPTDAMPLAPWAKITMALQALISLVLLGLVIARAVNIFA